MTQPAGGPVAMRVALLRDGRFELVGAIRAPAPDTIPDASFGILTQTYDDSVTPTARVRVKTWTPSGLRYDLSDHRPMWVALTATPRLVQRVVADRIHHAPPKRNAW